MDQGTQAGNHEGLAQRKLRSCCDLSVPSSEERLRLGGRDIRCGAGSDLVCRNGPVLCGVHVLVLLLCKALRSRVLPSEQDCASCHFRQVPRI